MVRPHPPYHGHVEAVLGTVRKLGLDTIIDAQRCRQRDLIVALMVERLIAPGSKLAATLHWPNTTLAEELGLGEVDVNEVYEAMDWLLERKSRIEKKLAKRHLREADQVLFDVSSSYYYGRMSQLAQFGHNRDGKQGYKIIVYSGRTADCLLQSAAGRRTATPAGGAVAGDGKASQPNRSNRQPPHSHSTHSSGDCLKSRQGDPAVQGRKTLPTHHCRGSVCLGA